MWTKEFWMDLLERSIATFAETMLGFLAVGGTIDWKHALSVSAVAFLTAVFKCIVLRARTAPKE